MYDGGGMQGEHRVGGLDLLMALYVSTGTIYLIQLIEFLPAAALLKVMKRPCACLAWKPSYIVVASGFFFVTHQPIDRRFLAYTTASGHAFQGVGDRQWHLREDFQRILVSNA